MANYTNAQGQVISQGNYDLLDDFGKKNFTVTASAATHTLREGMLVAEAGGFATAEDSLIAAETQTPVDPEIP